MGIVDDITLNCLYRDCRALALLSTDEGWGLAVSEAMIFRKPLLLSRCGALPEVAGDVACYADHESVQDIASKMIRIFTQEESKRTQSEYDRAPGRSWHDVSEALTLGPCCCGRYWSAAALCRG
jgi:glycosyltransferase involved in cell wall biosynthesis